ncbi:hypothetical protein V9L05_12495 [Bernardetia sp. Wsw4-3y2]|uniref:hypothetical protein n=1 Tax=Bernardetia sp. Wsw4-3y2 TaxID=3127471 RepID=UPI0030D1D993
MKSNFVLFFILSFIVCSCGNKKTNDKTEENNIEEDSIFYIEHQPKRIKRDFPKAKKISEYPRTEFLPTLENQIPKNKNAIYCVTLLYAWEELRNTLSTTFEIPNELQNKQKDLVLINNSTSFKNVLGKSEYKVEGKIEDGVIIKAEFNKSLPFESNLYSFDNELIFQKQKVASFGVFGQDEDAEYIIHILYYKNDDEFVIKLLPKDQLHEILLFKTQENFKTLAQMNERLKENILKGKKELYNSKLNWKFSFFEKDEVVIPKLNFNIENNFEEIEGNQINAVSTNRKHSILRAWQRTAFVLDEKGAEIESEFEMMADSVAIIGEEIEEEKPKPKKMRFDKPFFVLLKKVDATNPYFVLYANNTELMLKE